MGAPPSGDMDIFGKDPVLTQAVALALMRQAKSLLEATAETDAAEHLQIAIDRLRRSAGDRPREAASAD